MAIAQSEAEPDRALSDATHAEINSPTRSGTSRRRRPARGTENETAQPLMQHEEQGAAHGAATVTPLRGHPQQRRMKAGVPAASGTVRSWVLTCAQTGAVSSGSAVFWHWKRYVYAKMSLVIR